MLKQWTASDHASDAFRRGRLLAWCAMLVFALTMWFAVPHGIGFSWRECDTQAMARNFLSDGFEPLRPRIDWRGDTDGAVESEFPLYQLAIATIMALLGESEWPGRLLALLAMLWAASSLHRLLEHRTGPSGALAGLLTFLVSGSSALLATRVMPDAFSLGLSLASLTAFVRFLATGSFLTFWLSMILLTLGALQKPPALQLGLVMFGWTALLAPKRLREPQLWLGFATVLAVVIAWLLHSKTLYDETGLTFGVISGGDIKFPNLEHLFSAKIHAQLAWTSLQYGLSAIGALALLSLLIKRRIDGTDLVLLSSVLLALYGALRYSYHHKMGPHYHVFAAVAGAWLVARAWPKRASLAGWTTLIIAITLQGAWRFEVERTMRSNVVNQTLTDIAASIRRQSSPDELLIVRSEKPRKDELWQRRHNYENPTMLYQSRRRGWVLADDDFTVTELERLRSRGARLIYNPRPGQTTPDVEQWLVAESEALITSPRFRLHRLYTKD